jgi:hypothetical protein
VVDFGTQPVEKKSPREMATGLPDRLASGMKTPYRLARCFRMSGGLPWKVIIQAGFGYLS